MADSVGEPPPALSPLAQQLQAAGFETRGTCDDLSAHSSAWRNPSALIEDLSDAEADTLGALMLRLRAAPGTVLIREGDVGDWMLLILQGTVDVTKATGSGEASRLAVITAGAAVGEMSMLDAAPRYASCTAIDAVEAALLTRATIGALIRDHPAIGAKLLVKLTQLLAQRLRNTSNQVVKLLQNK